MVSSFLTKDAFLPELQGDMLRGMIGMEAAATFIKFMDKNYTKPVSGKQVIEGFGTAQVDRNGQKMSVRKAVTEQGNDENMASVADVVSTLKAMGDLSITQVDNLASFALALSAECSIAFLKKLPNTMLRKLSMRDELQDRIASMMKELKGVK
jgi:hypothetical protein